MTDSSQKSNLQTAMDERLAEALATANYRLTLANQKHNARLKLQSDLTYSRGGGIFLITQELISFVTSLISVGRESAVLLDSNSNPIEVDDLQEFQEAIINIYYECMNDFLVEFKSIKKARTTKALVGE